MEANPEKKVKKMNLKCALEVCEKLVDPIKKTVEIESYPGAIPDQFCSERCLQGYGRWASWQKDLGNGIICDPWFDYGGGLRSMAERRGIGKGTRILYEGITGTVLESDGYRNQVECFCVIFSELNDVPIYLKDGKTIHGTVSGKKVKLSLPESFLFIKNEG